MGTLFTTGVIPDPNSNVAQPLFNYEDEVALELRRGMPVFDAARRITPPSCDPKLGKLCVIPSSESRYVPPPLVFSLPSACIPCRMAPLSWPDLTIPRQLAPTVGREAYKR